MFVNEHKNITTSAKYRDNKRNRSKRWIFEFIVTVNHIDSKKWAFDRIERNSIRATHGIYAIFTKRKKRMSDRGERKIELNEQINRRVKLSRGFIKQWVEERETMQIRVCNDVCRTFHMTPNFEIHANMPPGLNGTSNWFLKPTLLYITSEWSARAMQSFWNECTRHTRCTQNESDFRVSTH